MIYPLPKKSEPGVQVRFCGFCSVSGDCREFAEKTAVCLGLLCDCENAAGLVLKKESGEKLTYIEETRLLTDEKYEISVCEKNGKAEISVAFSSEKSLYYALLYLSEKAKNGSISTGLIQDYPLFAVRGFIEGFYGKPWSFEEREKMIRLLSKKRMNTYYYAPKDDPFHRDRWRELYSGDELEKLKGIIALCKESFIDFHYCIAPGLGMRYSSEEDYSALIGKLRSLYDIGVTHFGLLLDDIPETLYYAGDKEKFGNETVNAHIYLANRIFDDLKKLGKSITLTLCPMQYHGRGDEYFISKLGRGTDPEIKIFWTGYNICSQELTVPEAIRFIDSTRHRPLYWDNFPVNDAEMVNEMHLGCIDGREPELCRYSEGIISNCMEYAECSAVPLMTVADFLWAPFDYNPRESWKNAVKQAADDEAEALELFGDNLFFSCLKSENSSIFNEYAARAEQELFAGNPAGALGILEEYCQRLESCREVILKSEKKIFKELAPWANKQALACDVLRAALDYAKSQDENLLAAAKELLYSYKRLPEVIYDFSFVMTVERILQF